MIVIAHNIRSLYNVGSIFRTCDGAGVEKLYLTGYTGAPPRKEISKTALGAEETVPWEKIHIHTPLIRKLKKEGYWIVGIEKASKAKNIFTYDAPQKIVIVLGNEIRGLSPQLLKHCDDVVVIPMRGHKESLNVSVAAGIAMYVLSEIGEIS
jgi:tRNA G18 (ribose-2'-O)-methylase SpoU